MADNWKVTRQRNGRETVLFDGTEDDARKYVSDNFPRVHVEPGSPDSGQPDVLLKSPDGDYSAHVGPDNWQDTDENGVLDSENDEDEDDAPQRPAKKTAAKKTAAPAFTGRQ